jgi:NAD(P)-dependent dehydrogenase (short-subunit alcohol dehydrogenase family)
VGTPFRLDGRSALVTGCGSEAGIGFACAELLARLGARVTITSTTDRIEARAGELRAAGATVHEHQPSETGSFRVYLDPAGHPFDLCVNPGDPRTTLMGVMLDCPDAKALSHFYAELLGKPVTYEADGVAMIGEDGAQPVMFQQVEHYTAPRWPDPAYPQQIHLDVTVQDVDAAERAALDIGATRLDGAGPNWRVYADPVGKPFCLIWPV